MGTVMMHNAVSVDGFIADEKDQVGPLFDYYGNGDIELTDSAIADVPDDATAFSHRDTAFEHVTAFHLNQNIPPSQGQVPENHRGTR